MALRLLTTSAFERDLRRVKRQGKDLDKVEPWWVVENPYGLMARRFARLVAFPRKIESSQPLPLVTALLVAVNR